MHDHRPFLLFLIMPALALAGCLWPGQERVTGPQVGRARTVETLMPDGRLITSHDEITSKAASYQGKRVKEATFEDAWVESLPDGRTEAHGGGLSFEGFPLPSASGMKPLYYLGGLCIVAGVIVGWLCGWGLGLAIAGAGFAVIAAATLFDRYPWVALLPVVAGVGVGVWVLVDLYHGRKARIALTPIVQAIEAAPASAAAEVKEKVAHFAGQNRAKVKATISSLKGRLGHA